jgi:hypothetical protein
MPDPCVPDDPALLDDPALPEDELVPDEPPLAVLVLAWCAEPGSAKAITPAPTRPAAPTAAVVVRSRACPRRLAAAAERASGSGEFIGFPPSFSPQSGSRTWGSAPKRL